MLCVIDLCCGKTVIKINTLRCLLHFVYDVPFET